MLAFPIKLLPDQTSLDFVRTRWAGFAFSIIASIGTFVLLYTHGLNLGIDFAGGIMMELHTESAADLGALRKALNVPELGEVSLQTFGDDRALLVRIEANASADQSKLVALAKQHIAEVSPDIEYRQIEYVGPTVGKELIESGILALVLAMVAMMLYIWFRFEWQFGVGGILALLHDAIMVFGFYVVTGFDFNSTSIAAVLTIIGYSINDSVVIYDRIRENMRKYKKMPMGELINKSVNETLSRTVITGLTVVIAALAMALFGGDVIKGFSYALVFGVVIGTYSSVYISAPVLLYFNLRSTQPEDEPA